ncbi:hypothetical protein [Streptomyces spiralis]|nr:hypothetical protein [Streptomyces spiralis]
MDWMEDHSWVLAGVTVAVLAGGGLVAFVVSLPVTAKQTKQPAYEPLPPWVWPTVVAFVGAVASIGIFWGVWMFKERKEAAEKQRDALDTAVERLREKMELASLLEVNRLLLEKYHGIATDEAKKAFRASRWAMGIGLMILVGAFFAGWLFSGRGHLVFVGSLAAVGAAFTAYLTRTYMETHWWAMDQLNEYFNQPVLNGYFLTAQRIALDLPDQEKKKALNSIVAEVLASGRQMHQKVARVEPADTKAPKRRRRPRKPRRPSRASQADTSNSAQQSQ